MSMILPDHLEDYRSFTIQDLEGAPEVNAFFDIEGCMLSQLNVTGYDEDTVSLSWAQVAALIDIIANVTEPD